MSSRAKRRSAAFLTLALTSALTRAAAAQYAPPATGGFVALDEALHRLTEPRRLLVIGAHPDDEDTEVLTLAARGLGADAAYLSLSRGEGGQNLVGDELGTGLGLIRSRELEAARRVDGGRQFFTRAFDFGFSRSLDETARFWLPDSVLKDAVRIVRRFRPHVVVSVWSGTPRDGHGHHQMAGVIARRAFEVAGDPAAFPELRTEEGLDPWRPHKLYRSTYRDPEQATLTLETGGLDVRTGRTYHQIAMASRSRHGSQDMGQIQEIGPRRTRLRLEVDRTSAGEGDLFSGVPVEGEWLMRLADSLRQQLSAVRLGDAVPPLVQALERARRERVEPSRIALLEDAVAIAAGVVLDAVADRERALPGDTLEVSVRLYNAGRAAIRLSQEVVEAPQGWSVVLGDTAAILDGGAMLTRRARLAVPLTAAPTTPYFLRRPPRAGLYDLSDAPPAVRGEPFDPPLVTAQVVASIGGAPVTLRRAVTYRFNDPAAGERRRELRVLPALDVRLEPAVLVWSSTGPDVQRLTALVTANAEDTLAAQVRLVSDGGPPLPPPQSVTLTRAGETVRLAFAVRRPPGVDRGRVRVSVEAEARGATYGSGARQVAYPHIEPVTWYEPAEAVVALAPLVLPRGPIAYVRGAADRVPEALAAVGLDLEVLDGAAIATTDLSRFTAVVVGSRAYETDAALGRSNARLLEYVHRGGHVVVQYQQYEYVRGAYAPFELSIARPHDRVTDETAPVRVLEPGHAAFREPNPIGPDDWADWPQERGLYFAGTWDARWVPLIELADPGMPALRGGLLVARYGEGTYIYTGLSFFRAIPAGVPGAYRLFANLLALGNRRGS